MNLIDRDELINQLGISDRFNADVPAWVIGVIKGMPSAERKTGHWILIKGSNGRDYHKCSNCLHEQEITGVKNYCAVCGAKMEGEQDERPNKQTGCD